MSIGPSTSYGELYSLRARLDAQAKATTLTARSSASPQGCLWQRRRPRVDPQLGPSRSSVRQGRPPRRLVVRGDQQALPRTPEVLPSPVRRVQHHRSGRSLVPDQLALHGRRRRCRLGWDRAGLRCLASSPQRHHHHRSRKRHGRGGGPQELVAARLGRVHARANVLYRVCAGVGARDDSRRGREADSGRPAFADSFPRCVHVSSLSRTHSLARFGGPRGRDVRTGRNRLCTSVGSVPVFSE